MVTLWQQAEHVSQAARQSGALKPIETECLAVTENGLPFLVRVLSSLRDKTQALQRLEQASDRRQNPFLPPEPALMVTEIPPAHRCVLNKFCVIDRHLLLVTRAFESQSQELNRADFRALAICLADGPALAFFNGGPEAGASQPHKHLQLLPLDQIEPPPFASLLDAAAARGLNRVAELPFVHRLTGLPAGLFQDPASAADWLTQRYRELLNALTIGMAANGDIQQGYNLLMTDRWMLVVPRQREKTGDVSVNALGFVGWLLVKRREQAEWLMAQGLMHTLITVSGTARPYPR